jgi:hypothetical protein
MAGVAWGSATCKTAGWTQFSTNGCNLGVSTTVIPPSSRPTRHPGIPLSGRVRALPPETREANTVIAYPG